MTEEQPYSVTKRFDSFELRHYPAHLLAQVEVSGGAGSASNQGFGPLVSFISGGNATGQRIAMTAPVLQQQTPARTHLVSFVLPVGLSIEDVPAPQRSNVHRVAVPASDAVAMRFSGSWSDARFAREAQRLAQLAQAAGFTPQGEAMFARFDPPWTPWFLRRNEVVFRINPPNAAATSTGGVG